MIKDVSSMSLDELRAEVQDLRRANKRLIRTHRKSIEREKGLVTLIKKYIRHVIDNEGTDFLMDSHRTRYNGYEEFTDQQWAQLQSYGRGREWLWLK